VRFSRAHILLPCVLATCALGLRAQDWDAATQAQGWSRQDKDDSFTFYDPATKALHTWMQDGGDLRAIPLGRLKTPPAKWIMDPRGSAWILSGTSLTQVQTDGSLGRTLKLPAEVASVCWDTKGFILSYQTRDPYLEKRRYQDGDVVWTSGTKPGSKDPVTDLDLHPLLMDDLDHILLGNERDLNLVLIGGDTGKQEGVRTFTFNGGPVPQFLQTNISRGPMCLWSGKNIAFASLQATNLPEAVRGTFQGQVLARLDLNNSTLSFLPTGLSDAFLLVGVLNGQAVFVNPKGGLMQVPVK